jgi:hypothetical protein
MALMIRKSFSFTPEALMQRIAALTARTIIDARSAAQGWPLAVELRRGFGARFQKAASAEAPGAAIDNPPATRLPIPAETRTMTTLAGAADQGVRSSADSHFSNPASFSRARVAATTPVKATKG